MQPDLHGRITKSRPIAKAAVVDDGYKKGVQKGYISDSPL